MSVTELVGLFGRALRDRAFYAVVLAAAAGWLLPWLVQRELLARLDAARRARAWNGLTWACAILWIGPLSMIPFCFVTRPVAPVSPARATLRGALALVRGAVWSAVLIAVLFGVEYAIGRAFGVELTPDAARAR